MSHDHRTAEHDQLRALPIAVRPRRGETVESYIRRLARANHLRPSYLRRYLAGRPGLSAVRPERLVGLSGRTADTLTRALADFDATPRRPQRTDRLRRRHSEKPALYRAIRAVLAAEPDTSVKSLCTRFRVGARTVALAIASPEPPPWKPPNKKSLLGLPAIIDALLERQPFISAVQVWEQILDNTDVEVSYGNVAMVVNQRRTYLESGMPTVSRP